ncbi:MAG TPA: Gfo/Idh/MocA family oxidoreductase [Thermoanaerobaculia bacterium]|nr:Gfo/Idh/MocA family oxidoreductase [Thermoanaerobaculia bacterium]
MQRRIRMGMVGGGRGAFIGNVHRMAAQLDGSIELVCGALSSDPERASASARDWFLPEDRSYGSFHEMFERERERDDAMDFAAIVTPNHLHLPVAEAALRAGFHVMCDKPMTHDVAEAERLVALVEETGLLFGLTHNYTGYPLVKEARQRVAEGELGAIRKVVVEYPQGWLAGPLEQDGQKQAAWRTDPARAGAAGAMGDIGTHAANLAEYVTGLPIESVCADLTAFVPGRRLDDDGNVLLRFADGARGVLYASQVSIDDENALALRVYGERGGLEWHQEEPNSLVLKWPDRPRQVLRTASHGLGEAAARAARLPAGHPEGFIEAFANLYRGFALGVAARLRGDQPPAEAGDVPTVHDGLRGMRFVEAVVASSRSERKWTTLA